MALLHSEGQYRQQRHINSSDFFAGLIAKAKEIGEEEGERMATTMLHVLHNRQGMGAGNGRFPRWDPNRPKANGKRAGGTSKKMFNTFKKQKRSSGEYWIFTDGVGAGKHNYAQNLMTGRNWPSKVKNGQLMNLVAKGDRLYSKQMPNGIDPWLKIKRKLFEDRVRERISKEL